MKEKELNVFLASVRRTRFVDYLDPLGETAQNALERRLSWARVSQHDPAYAGEARFLLDNAEGLRDVLRRELEEDDWVEEADVGREWESRESSLTPRMRENDRVTEIFQADDLEVSSAPQKVQARARGGAPLPSPPRSTPYPPPSRSVAVSEPPQKASARSGEPPRRSPEPPRRGAETAPRGMEPARRVEPPRSPMTSSSNPAQARTSGAGPSRTAPGAMGRTGTPGPSSRASSSNVPDSLPPMRDSRAPVSRSPRSDPYGEEPASRGDIGRSRNDPARGRAEQGRAEQGRAEQGRAEQGRAEQGRGGTARGEPQWSPPRNDNRSGRRSTEDESTSPMPPNGGGPQQVDLDDWDAPDDPVSTTGIMRLEDVTGPSRQEIVVGVDSVETVTIRSSRSGASASVVEDHSTAPSVATRLRRPSQASTGSDTPVPPGKRAAVMAAMPMPRVRASVDPAPRRSRVLPLLIAMSMLGLLVIAVASAVIVPLIYSHGDFEDTLAQLGFGQAEPGAPEGGIVPPPEVVAAQVPEALPEGQAAAPATADGTPAIAGIGAVPPDPSSAGSAPPVATAPVPQPPAPAPVVAAAPTPAPAPVPKAVAKPEPPPEPQPEAPRSSAPPVDVSGLWIGSTSTASSFKLTILGQTEGDFEGTVEVQVEDGTFTSLAITGKVDGNGVISFRDGAAQFNGKVAGRKVTGTYTLSAGATPVSWSAVH